MYMIASQIYKQLLKSKYLPILVVGGNDIITEATQACSRFANWKGTMTGQNLYDMYPVEELRYLMYRHKKANIEKSEGFLTIPVPMGRVVFAFVEVFSLSEYEDTYLLLFHDVTDSFEAQMMLESTMELSEEMFLCLDSNERVLYSTEVAAETFGFSSRSQLQGIHYRTFLPRWAGHELIDKAFEALHCDEKYEAEFERVREGITHSYWICAVTIHVKNTRVGYIFEIKETNERKEKQEHRDEKLRRNKLNETKFERAEYFYINEEQYKGSSYWKLILELKQAVNCYEYVRANEYLERLIMLAPEQDVKALQEVQNEIGELRYNQAEKILSKILERKENKEE